MKSTFLQAQSVEMAELFRSEGKIFVVLAVLGIVFAGIAAYLIWLERRLTKLEKKK